MIAKVRDEFLQNEFQLLALCLWREARGESLEAKRGIVHVLQNRCNFAPREGFKPTLRENILKPWAFSSFMEGDPNATKYPKGDDPSWTECWMAIAQAGLDNTDGAVFYYSRPLVAPPKAWGPVGVHIAHTVDIGDLHFYKLL